MNKTIYVCCRKTKWNHEGSLLLVIVYTVASMVTNNSFLSPLSNLHFIPSKILSISEISVSCFSPNSVCRASVRSGKSGCLVKLDAVNYSPLAVGHKVDTNNSLIILEKGCFLDHHYHRYEKVQLFPIKHIYALGYVCNKPFVRDGVLMGRKLLDVVSSQGSKQQKFERIRGTS